MTVTSPRPPALPTRRQLLAGAAGAAALAAGALHLGVLTKPGQIADAELASLIQETIPAPARRVLNDLARPLLPYLLAPLAALLFLRGLVRRQWRRCLATAAALPAIPLSIWLRDEVVRRPDFGVPGYDWNTFPPRTRPWDSWCSPRWPSCGPGNPGASVVDWRVLPWPPASSSRSATSPGMPTARSTCSGHWGS